MKYVKQDNKHKTTQFMTRTCNAKGCNVAIPSYSRYCLKHEDETMTPDVIIIDIQPTNASCCETECCECECECCCESESESDCCCESESESDCCGDD